MNDVLVGNSTDGDDKDSKGRHSAVLLPCPENLLAALKVG